MEYSFGIPGNAIWLTHIIIGIILTYIGYMALNHQPVGQLQSLFLIMLGLGATFYHSHLMYLNFKGKPNK